MIGIPSRELVRIERDYAGGIPAKAILDAFRPTGVRLSEATFRKYVQAGLLPRSRRVGEKGKHRGSKGLYPVESVRTLSAIKRMMAKGMTLEDIRGSFLVFRNRLDALERAIQELLDSFSTALAARSFGAAERRRLTAQIAALRRRARSVVHDLVKLGGAITSHAVRS